MRRPEVRQGSAARADYGSVRDTGPILIGAGYSLQPQGRISEPAIIPCLELRARGRDVNITTKTIIPLVAFTFCLCLVRELPAQTSLAVYGQLPFMSDLALSPDGTRFAFATTTATDETAVIVSAVSDLHQVAGVGSGVQKIRKIQWAGDDQLLIMASWTTDLWGYWAGAHEYLQLYGCQVSACKVVSDLMNRQFSQSESAHYFGYITGWPRARLVSGKTIVFVRGASIAPTLGDGITWGAPALLKMPFGVGNGIAVDIGDPGNDSWLLDESGQIVAVELQSMLTNKWSIKLRIDGSMRTVLSGDDLVNYPSLQGIDPDGKSVWLRSDVDGPNRWTRLSLEDGSNLGPLPESEQYRRVLMDRRADRIIGVEMGDEYRRYKFFDPDTNKRWEAVYKAVSDMHPQLISGSDDQRKFILLLQTKSSGLRYVLVNLEDGKVAALGPAYKGLTSVAEVQAINYAAGDGLNIPGYLTLPSGRDPKNLPLVVLPHGGPQVYDTAEFDWLSQGLAAAGYAVLRPNFRGSTLSQTFEAAGYGQWGRKMQTDLSDGVRHLAELGLIDPKRVCIVGGSYGGYAALAGVALEPGVYRCAVSIGGISDMQMFVQDLWGNAIRNTPALKYFERFIGINSLNDKALNEISPIEHVLAITAPVLLIHGRDDTVVKYKQSQVMADAMRRAGKNVTLVDLKQEDHWLSRSATRLQTLEAVVAFLQANNPP
jgi:pimeloyl-ACP methyl ester carboxylesterase